MLQEAIQKERLHDALILVVDDLETNRAMLIRSLNSRGYRNILHARDGAQALQITQDLKPDLVILDLVMPGMDGFSYCQAVRRDHAFDNMPIIIQTVLDEVDDKIKAFHMGASDYICRPIDPDELSARTQVHLTTKMLVEDLHLYNERINAEMAAARAMQNRLMPDDQHVSMCERIFDMKIGGYFETCSALGGDSWGMRPLSDQKLAIYQYDFSGHGVSAAMNIFRLHTLMQECLHAGGDPGNFLTSLNRHLHPLLERHEFATMFYGVIDTAANCLLYSSAATPPPILFGKSDPEPIILNGRGFPLGVVANAVFETQYTPFMPDDMLLAYSDCLVESKNNKGHFLTEAQIKDCVLAASRDAINPARQSMDALLALLRAHTDSQIFNDDITMNIYWRYPVRDQR